MPLFDGALGGLLLPQRGRNRRISSNEQPNWSDGNFDMTPLPPAARLELPVLEGPGVINHIWMTSHAGGVGELNALSLRIYWDGREEPGVEAPLGEFFAVGQGRPAPVESYPVQVSPSGSLSCYWRMPFEKSARIVIVNDNPDRTSGLYWQVDWVQLPELPPETPYFHARYRQEYPATMGRDYLLADIEGAGHYVGTVMSVTMAQDGWFGEGDDFFFIDGEEVPSLQGTGTEDYFNDAWGFRERTGNWFGQPRWQGWSAGDSGVCYRWHVLDPVAFEQSLRVTIEHKGNRTDSEDSWFIERPDFLNSVAYWYQTGLPKRFGELPPWPDRCVPWQRSHLVRAFQAARVVGSARPSVSTEGFFGGRPMLVWPNSDPDGRLTVPFSVEAAGRYAVRLQGFGVAGGGAFDIEIDGVVALRGQSLAGEGESELDLLLGVQRLDVGVHALGFVATGGIGGLAIESLSLLALPEEAVREVRNHNEAHFIRLGVGRAVYAYRLAYDRLPASLAELAQVGLMPERFLTDENHAPMESSCEGDRFVVRAREWNHFWFGLDARR